MQALEFTTPYKLACKCRIYHLWPSFSTNLHSFCTIFAPNPIFRPGGAVVFGNTLKYTLAKREEVCMNGLQSTIGMYHGFRELFRILWSSQGRRQVFFRGALNFPNAPVIFASGSYDL